MFIKAENELFSEKDEIIENTKTMMDMVCNTDGLDMELGDKVTELNIIAEQMQTAIAENSRTAIDQNEYERRYADLTERYNTIKADYDKISEQIESKKALIIPGLFEPPVRTLRATIPENESHIFR